MSTRENRQYREGKPNFRDVPVEEQKRLSREAQESEESDETNEDIAEDEARNLDELRAHPESLPGQHVEDDYSGRLA